MVGLLSYKERQDGGPAAARVAELGAGAERQLGVPRASGVGGRSGPGRGLQLKAAGGILMGPSVMGQEASWTGGAHTHRPRHIHTHTHPSWCKSAAGRGAIRRAGH